VSAAKSYIGEHATTLAQECVQLHGGIGVTWEHDLHMFVRRITLYRSMFGTPAEHHRAIYTRLRNAGSAA
jgi:alkylation response protein AidB-like acyl-CoA dehydrogenase